MCTVMLHAELIIHRCTRGLFCFWSYNLLLPRNFTNELYRRNGLSTAANNYTITVAIAIFFVVQNGKKFSNWSQKAVEFHDRQFHHLLCKDIPAMIVIFQVKFNFVISYCIICDAMVYLQNSWKRHFQCRTDYKLFTRELFNVGAALRYTKLELVGYNHAPSLS